MHREIEGLKTAVEQAKSALRREAEAGMLVARAQFDLSRADEALTRARADVHLFRPYAVQQAAAGGLTIARMARAEAARLGHERAFRRKGLLLSLGLIVLSIVALVAKIRDLDRRRRP